VLTYKGQNLWACRCRLCGRIVLKSTSVLTRCTFRLRCERGADSGCSRQTVRMAHPNEYGSWIQARARTTNPKNPSWALYGGRGIEMCPRWRNSFWAFVEDMAPRPSPDHSLDRIDNDGNYEPGNVRWATAEEQANNTRSNVFLEHEGRRQTVTQWERERELPIGTIRGRIRLGWGVPRAIETPLAGLQTRALWAEAVKVPCTSCGAAVQERCKTSGGLTPARPHAGRG